MIVTDNRSQNHSVMEITGNPSPGVLVFSTSVHSSDHVNRLAPVLNSFAGKGRWNFALDDCDRILRILSKDVEPVEAIQLLHEFGFECKELE